MCCIDMQPVFSNGWRLTNYDGKPCLLQSTTLGMSRLLSFKNPRYLSFVCFGYATGVGWVASQKPCMRATEKFIITEMSLPFILLSVYATLTLPMLNLHNCTT